jgi:hypothetical protein
VLKEQQGLKELKEPLEHKVQQDLKVLKVQ